MSLIAGFSPAVRGREPLNNLRAFAQQAFPQRLRVGLKNKALIAAVNRCANQEQLRLKSGPSQNLLWKPLLLSVRT